MISVGKHSAPESTPFLRSIVAWALPWMLIVAVVAVALLVAVRMVDDDPVQASGPASDATTTEPEAEPEGKDDKKEAPTKDEDEQSETGKEDEGTERDPTEEPEVELDAEGIALQVLNGTSDAAADDLVADRLARLGYSVVAVSPASRAYPRTVVVWVGDREEAARALAERFEWQAQPAPSNLSTEVDLHVVVGNDAA